MPGSIEEVVQITRIACPTILQLHGDESPTFLASLREELDREGFGATRIIKTIGVAPDSKRDDLLKTCKSYSDSIDGVLLDSKIHGSSGGTGAAHDWEVSRWLVGILDGKRVILAGGLNPGNVARAISAVKPFGVDVSSGVETRPGRKDPEMVKSFICAARGLGR